MTENDGANFKPALLLVERERWIKHNNQLILVHDYSGLLPEEATRVVKLHGEAVYRRRLFDLLLLVDVTDAQADKDTLLAFKEESARNNKVFRKVAIIGVVGVVKFFLKVVDSVAHIGARPFDSKEEALDWLAELPAN